MVHIAYIILIIIIRYHTIPTYMAYYKHRSNSVGVHIAKLSLKHPSNIARYRKSLTLPNFPDETLNFRTATAITEEQCSHCPNTSATLHCRRSALQCEPAFKKILINSDTDKVCREMLRTAVMESENTMRKVIINIVTGY